MAAISVVVPVYKVEKYLNKCVESILAQTFADFELILVDDGSPDNCPAMCDEWAEKDNRVRVIHKENGGVWAARCDGVDAAVTQWIAFCDSDDWLEPDFLEKMYDAALQNDADIVQSSFGTPGALEDVASEIWDRETITKELLPQFLGGERCKVLPSMWSHIFKRSILLRAIEFVPEGQANGEDYICVAASLLYCAKAVRITYCGYNYRDNEDSNTHNYFSVYREQQHRFWTAIYNIAEYAGILLPEERSHRISRGYMTCLWRCGISDMAWENKLTELDTIMAQLPKRWEKLPLPTLAAGPGCRIYFMLLSLGLVRIGVIWAKIYDWLANSVLASARQG